MYSLLRPLLFRIDPERVHAISIALLRMAGSISPRCYIQKRFSPPHNEGVDVFGLHFRNPIGLAAGYDKDGLAWRGLAYMGFGHIEVGTVTLKPQVGNPKPRLHRLVEEQAIINRLGFPGLGADFVANRLKGSRHPNLVLGVNIGKNKDTPIEEAEKDYLKLLEIFAPLADYIVINISSPNTVGLRKLQKRHYLENLLAGINSRRQALNKSLNKNLPILVKLSPDLDNQALDDALEIIQNNGIDGVVATNTTINRDNINSTYSKINGGLSGKPLTLKSTEFIRQIYKRTNGKLPIIAVGGIMSGKDAQLKLKAGATLVQLFTGLIYRGPALVKEAILATNPKSIKYN